MPVTFLAYFALVLPSNSLHKEVTYIGQSVGDEALWHLLVCQQRFRASILECATATESPANARSRLATKCTHAWSDTSGAYCRRGQVRADCREGYDLVRPSHRIYAASLSKYVAGIKIASNRASFHQVSKFWGRLHPRRFAVSSFAVEGVVCYVCKTCTECTFAGSACMSCALPSLTG